MDPKYHLATSNPVHTGLALTSCKAEDKLKFSFLNDCRSVNVP